MIRYGKQDAWDVKVFEFPDPFSEWCKVMLVFTFLTTKVKFAVRVESVADDLFSTGITDQDFFELHVHFRFPPS